MALLRDRSRCLVAAFLRSAALILAFVLPNTNSANAQNRQLTIWSGALASNGGVIATTRLQHGQRYQVRIAGAVHFGTWKPTKRALKNDACFEFNSGRGAVSLPIIQNSHGLNFCARGYSARHVYQTQLIYGDGRALTLRVFDTDYRDNYGSFNVQVVLMR